MTKHILRDCSYVYRKGIHVQPWITLGYVRLYNESPVASIRLLTSYTLVTEIKMNTDLREYHCSLVFLSITTLFGRAPKVYFNRGGGRMNV